MSDIGFGGDDFLDVLIAAVFVIPLSALILAIWALAANRGLRRRVDALTEKMRMVDHRVIRLGEAATGSAAAEPRAAAPEPAAPAEPAAPEPAAAPRPEAPASPPPAPPAVRGRSWEQILAENWLVWLGGATLALGGAFLVKLSIDYGLMTPAVRVAAAIVLGIGLAVGGDVLARREGSSSYVAQALTAAGAAIVFAALYAAYQLYGLVPAALAFPLLAATAGAALGMSLRHGPYVAALGLAGAYAVPLLVAGDNPQATPLFAYLIVVTAAILALLRHRAWWWLAWPSLAGIVFWPLLWLAGAAHPEAAIVAVYLLAQYGLFAAFRRGIDRVGFLGGVADSPQVRALTRIAFWALALPLLVLVQVDGFGTVSLVATFAAAIFVLWFAWRDPALDDVIAVAGALLVLMLASWELPLNAAPSDFGIFGRPPAQVTSFLSTAIAAGLLLGGGCWVMLGRVARPGRWAMLSAGAPKTILIVAYWRLHTLLPDLGWSGIALVLAALALGALGSVARSRDGNTETETAIAAYATAVLAGTILAAVFALSTAWLSVALALHLPAMGWIDGRVRAPVLRRLALGVAITVLARLVLNPYVLDYPLAATPIFNWLLYGYGVPALAFIIATRQFGSRADDLTTAVLEAGSIVFTTALLTLELRHALTGHIATPLADLGRDSSNALLWLVLSGGLLWLGARKARPVLAWGGIVLFAAATAQIVLWQMLTANPLATGDPVGRKLILDALATAYALPAIAYALIARRRLGPNPVQWTGRILAVALSLLWLSLEIRHAFRGENLIWGVCGEGEWYAYSAAWLAYAAIALGLGLTWRAEWLRRAALAGIGLVALKVFISDMAELTGILRALSFMGLGAVLIGIGYAYRRMQPLAEVR
jgi:uncharacterized membrane protein